MRPINVTLCSHTWELAKQKNNFSAWVRKKLDEEHKKRSVDREEYHAYCKKCDITYTNKLKFMVEFKHCEKCYEKCEFDWSVEE